MPTWTNRPIERIGDDLLIVLDRTPTHLYAVNARYLHLRTPYAEALRLVGATAVADGRPEVVRPGEGSRVNVASVDGVGFTFDVMWHGVRYASPGAVYAVHQPGEDADETATEELGLPTAHDLDVEADWQKAQRGEGAAP